MKNTDADVKELNLSIYKDLQEFCDKNANISSKLLAHIEKRQCDWKWKNSKIISFPTFSDFAKFKVQGTVLLHLPYLNNYIDYNRLGQDLVKQEDETICYFDEETNKIIVTTFNF